MNFVAIPTRESFDTLQPLVTALLADKAVDRLLLMDNGHSFEAQQWMLAIPDPRVSRMDTEGYLLHHMWNVGWEQAIREGADYVAILNDDIITPAGMIGHMADALDRHPEYWIVSPDWENYTMDSPWSVTGNVRECHGVQRHHGISGWCFMIRADLREHGVTPFDENLVWYGGDEDLVYQIEEQGGKAGHVIGLPLEHYTENTSKNYPHLTRIAFTDDRKYFAEKWGPHRVW